MNFFSVENRDRLEKQLFRMVSKARCEDKGEKMSDEEKEQTLLLSAAYLRLCNDVDKAPDDLIYLWYLEMKEKRV